MSAGNRTGCCRPGCCSSGSPIRWRARGRGMPRVRLASLFAALPVEEEKRGSRVPGRCLSSGLERRRFSTACRSSPPACGSGCSARSPECSCASHGGRPSLGDDNGTTAPRNESRRLFTLACIDPAPLNSCATALLRDRHAHYRTGSAVWDRDIQNWPDCLAQAVGIVRFTPENERADSAS